MMPGSGFGIMRLATAQETPAATSPATAPTPRMTTMAVPAFEEPASSVESASASEEPEETLWLES